MINKILSSVAGDLNQYLRARFNFSEDPVVMGNLIGLDGSVSVEGENKIVMTLINIEQETNIPRAFTEIPISHTSRFSGTPPVFVNLFILIWAFFQNSNYNESLKMLSSVISYFQKKPTFTPHNTSGLNDNIEKITFEILNLSVNELSNLWGQLGGKYLPSIIYKLRMITFDSDYPVEIVEGVTMADNKVAKL
jgi:hypothetical protein